MINNENDESRFVPYVANYVLTVGMDTEKYEKAIEEIYTTGEAHPFFRLHNFRDLCIDYFLRKRPLETRNETMRLKLSYSSMYTRIVEASCAMGTINRRIGRRLYAIDEVSSKKEEPGHSTEEDSESQMVIKKGTIYQDKIDSLIASIISTKSRINCILLELVQCDELSQKKT